MNKPILNNRSSFKKNEMFSGITAVIFALLIPFVIVVIRGDFDLKSRFISELGAHGEPYEMLIRWGSFFPAGVLFLVFSFRIIRPLFLETGSRWMWILISFWGIGWASSALFPCDPGCPFTGSFSQIIHGFIVLPPYVFGVPVGLVLVGRHVRSRLDWSMFAFYCSFTGYAFLVLYIASLSGFFEAYRGSIQWVAELLFGIWTVWLTALLWVENKLNSDQSGTRLEKPHAFKG